MSGRAVRALLDALYPDIACPLCGREGVARRPDGACADCASALRLCPAPVHTEPLDGLAAAYFYEGPAREAVLRLKYGGATYLADFFAAGLDLPADWEIDCIVPVPLHWTRLLRRGYNQSEMLARALAQRYPGLPVRTDVLRRARRTRSQTSLSAAQRKKNLRGAFAAFPLVEGLSVLLVDDVATTRATLGACARALKRRGAKRVYAACACAAIE